MKTWDDQPDEVLSAVQRLHFYANERIIEVRESRDCFLISVGNLFGSETVKAKSLNAMFAAVHLAATVKSGQHADLPEGCEVLHA